MGHMRDTKTKGRSRVKILWMCATVDFFFFFDVAVDFDNVYNVFFFSYRDMGVGNPYRNGY